jgi:hypothetical protein
MHERIAARELKRTADKLESAKASKAQLKRASALAGARIDGLARQVHASKRLRGPETRRPPSSHRSRVRWASRTNSSAPPRAASGRSSLRDKL